MAVVGLFFGILSIIGMLVAFIPCLGALNWLVIPFAIIGLIISAIALSSAESDKKGTAIAGLVCCGIAVLFGLLRLIFGGGVL